MRAARLIDLVALLRRHERLTAGQLAQRLEVSRRTVLRDLQELSLSGVPVFAERGRRGGFSILPGYRPETAGLTGAEAEALFLPGGEQAADALGRGPDYRAARRKLEAVLSSDVARAVGDVSSWLLVAPEGWGRTVPTSGAVAPLAAAAARREVIDLRYRAVGEGARTRRVRPLGLVLAGRTWYLLACRDDSGEQRSYRVDRVTQVVPTGRQFEPPTTLAKAWARARQGLQESGGVELRVRTREEALPVVRYLVSLAGRVTGTRRVDDGTFEVGGLVPRIQVAAALLAGLGERGEVLGPPELLEAIVALSRTNLERYDGAGDVAGSSVRTRHRK
jgi:predicted DNA-binding transcriptional regulator YafY